MKGLPILWPAVLRYLQKGFCVNSDACATKII